MCCWYDVHDEAGEGEYLGQYVWELFSTAGRQGLAGRAMWHMRRACGGRGAGTELQVHGRNTGARACYERLGGRRTAWWAGGVEAGEGRRWREPGRGQEMMRFEAAALDGALGARGSGREVEGEEVVIAESLEELREEGILEGVRRAAGGGNGAPTVAATGGATVPPGGRRRAGMSVRGDREAPGGGEEGGGGRKYEGAEGGGGGTRRGGRG